MTGRISNICYEYIYSYAIIKFSCFSGHAVNIVNREKFNISGKISFIQIQKSNSEAHL